MQSCRRCSAIACVLLVIPLSSGCGPSAEQSNMAVESQLRMLGRLYGEFMAQNNGRAPADEKELTEFLKGASQLLQSRGIGNVQEFLISPRDREPLVVLYGKDIIPDGPGGLPWVGYESIGVDGKRYMIGARGAAEEMTKKQIEAILPQ